MDAAKLLFPHPGEIVHSVVQRTHEVTGIPVSQIRESLSGDSSLKGVLATIPARLAELSDHVLAEHPWAKRDTLALQYTLFPYYTYFDDNSSREYALELVARESSSYLKVALGMTQRGITRRATLRICRGCIADDEVEIGFSYFHREHQAPASLVCWRHGNLLEIGCANCGNYPLNQEEAGMPGKCRCGEAHHPIYECHADDQNLEPMRWLANEIAYLLFQEKTTVQGFRKRLKEAARQHCRTAGSAFKYSVLANQVEQRFGNSLLRFLGYPAWTDHRPSPWLRRAFSERRRGSPTLIFLLLIGAISSTIQEFEKRIVSAPIQANLAGTPAPVDAKQEQTSQQWKGRLKHALTNGSIHAAAESLGVTISQVAREAILQQIRVPLSKQCGIREDRLHEIHAALIEGTPQTEVMQRYEVGTWALQRIFLDRPGLFAAHAAAKETWYLNMHKSKIVEAVASNPGISLFGIQQTFPASYDYVQKHDESWLRTQINPKKGKWCAPKESRRIVDSEVAARVQSAVEMIRSKPRPTRMTIGLILKTAGLSSSSRGHLADLPLTQAIVAQQVESLDLYRDRKIRWAIEELANSKTPVSLDTLRRKAAMSPEWLLPKADLIRRICREIGAEINPKSVFAR
jgi:hypothetical protein